MKSPTSPSTLWLLIDEHLLDNRFNINKNLVFLFLGSIYQTSWIVFWIWNFGLPSSFSSSSVAPSSRNVLRSFPYWSLQNFNILFHNYPRNEERGCLNQPHIQYDALVEVGVGFFKVLREDVGLPLRFNQILQFAQNVEWRVQFVHGRLLGALILVLDPLEPHHEIRPTLYAPSGVVVEVLLKALHDLLEA